jgi:hypothetical protein
MFSCGCDCSVPRWFNPDLSERLVFEWCDRPDSLFRAFSWNMSPFQGSGRSGLFCDYQHGAPDGVQNDLSSDSSFLRGHPLSTLNDKTKTGLTARVPLPETGQAGMEKPGAPAPGESARENGPARKERMIPRVLVVDCSPSQTYTSSIFVTRDC